MNMSCSGRDARVEQADDHVLSLDAVGPDAMAGSSSGRSGRHPICITHCTSLLNLRAGEHS